MTSAIIHRYSKKTIPDLIKLTTVAFNSYIRYRDSDNGYFKCISCDKIHSTSQMDAGHYFSAGHYSSIRFDERNVHGQCKRCNMHLHGNLLNYRFGLIEKIGKSEVEQLEQAAKIKGFRWDRFSLIDIITTYKEKVKISKAA